jgi:hypothetical protein
MTACARRPRSTDGGATFSRPAFLHAECDFYFYAGGTELLSDGTVVHVAAGESTRESDREAAEGDSGDCDPTYGGLQRALRSTDGGQTWSAIVIDNTTLCPQQCPSWAKCDIGEGEYLGAMMQLAKVRRPKAAQPRRSTPRR